MNKTTMESDFAKKRKLQSAQSNNNSNPKKKKVKWSQLILGIILFIAGTFLSVASNGTGDTLVIIIAIFIFFAIYVALVIGKKSNIKENSAIAENDTIRLNPNQQYRTITNTGIPSTGEETLHHLITTQTPEEAAHEEFILRKRMLAGEQIDFSQCNSLLDTVNDVELWEIIVKNHLSQPNKPSVDLINNYPSERTIQFTEMIYRIVSSCVATNSAWCQLSPKFLKDVIVFSKNIDALYCIADMQESDLLESEYDENLFKELKQCAYNRYYFLTTKRNSY